MSITTKATEQDIARALDLRSPHVNAIVAELRHLRDVVAYKPIMQRFEQACEQVDVKKGWDETERAIADAPITWIPALFIQIVQRSKSAWRDREAMLSAAGKAWDKCS